MDVAGAARRTLASGSARVWECRFSEQPVPPERSFTVFAEGVADLAKVRLLMHETIAPGWDRVTDRVLERWPWLEELDEDDDCDDREFAPVIVRAGTAGYLGNGDNWMRLGLMTDPGDPSAGRRRPADPLWIVEALTLVDETGPRSAARELVRGDACNRAWFRIGAERVRGDVWIDGDERLRRVTWRKARKRRPRSPGTHWAHWRTVELWDFGIPVDIEIPTPMEPPEPVPTPRAVYNGIGALWRAKRAYDRRQGDI